MEFEVKNTILFTFALPQNEGINLTKYVQDLPIWGKLQNSDDRNQITK